MSVVNYKAKYKATDLLKSYNPHSFYEIQTAKKLLYYSIDPDSVNRAVWSQARWQLYMYYA